MRTSVSLGQMGKAKAKPIDSTRPRKLARQDRAKATVDAIIRATAIVLVDVGYERATTNRIAERAGVNIASLYQYFPNKDALVAALIDRHFESVLGRVGDSSGRAWTSGPALARTLVASYFELFRAEPELHAVLFRSAQRVRRVEALEEARRAVVTKVALLLDAVSAELVVGDRELAAFTVVHTLEALAIAAFTQRPEALRSGKVASEAADLITRYLFGRARPKM